jgi:endonuclease/exonuclease/phosphatase family metal-dependent hydrolase
LKRVFIVSYLSILLLSSGLFAQESLDTIRVMTYNVLNYNGSARNTYLQTVVSSVDPDVIIVQEMLSQDGVNSFLANVLNDQYETITFNNGPDTDNHIFYKSAKILFVEDDYLSTTLRDIAEYEVKIKSSNETVFFYSMHLKASQGTDNEQRRLEEATVLREHLQWHYPGTNFIVAGDFNIYNSTEPAYQKLILEENNIHSQSFDPINKPGSWHNSGSFAGIHTQSSRSEQLPDGGSTGGLDDRFDFILMSNALWDNVSVSSYTSYGNDGAHFNQSINAGTNSAVGTEIANALYYASDHLPVYCDFVFQVPTSAESESDISVDNFQLYQNYPNPFNPSTVISWQLAVGSQVDLTIYNLLGEKVATPVSEYMNPGVHNIEFDASGLVSGVYYYHLHAGEFQDVQKMILLK